MVTNEEKNSESKLEADEVILEPINSAEEIEAIKDILPENEARELGKIQRDVFKSYSASVDKMSVEEWLPTELQKQLPEKSADEIKEISSGIIDSLKITEEKRKAQLEAFANGQNSASWLKSDLIKSTSAMSTLERAKYLDGIDKAVKKANEEMAHTILTGAGVPSQCPNLDGFIAEQQHVNSFNLNAQASGNTGVHAEVLKPKSGEIYAANSVDIAIKDSNGNIVRRYQAKFGATAQDTIKYIKEGDYRGQRILVPEEQVEEVQKAFPNRKVSSTISDGKTESKPLTKKDVKKLQEEAQAGKSVLEQDWNAIDNKALATGIGKEVGKAGLMGVAIGGGMELASKIWNGEKIDGDKVVEKAVTTGADFGVKSATACAIKAASEKGVISCIPKGTPAGTIANIAYVAVENVKILGKVLSGEMSLKQGLSAAADATCATVAGIAASVKGSAIGAAIGTVLGPVGTAVGGFVGGTIGYIAGSKFGQAVSKAAKKVCSAAKTVVKTAAKVAVGAVKTVGKVLTAPFRWLFG